MIHIASMQMIIASETMPLRAHPTDERHREALHAQRRTALQIGLVPTADRHKCSKSGPENLEERKGSFWPFFFLDLERDARIR
jgi:hypothetical protein